VSRARGYCFKTRFSVGATNRATNRPGRRGSAQERYLSRAHTQHGKRVCAALLLRKLCLDAQHCPDTDAGCTRGRLGAQALKEGLADEGLLGCFDPGRPKGLPLLVPCLRARSRPTLILCLIMLRSNSANAPVT
jgi:hypothetical protein